MTENHQRQFAAGSKIGEVYRIRGLLGRGGMGEVYLVEHADTSDFRAVKIMRSLTDTSPEHLHKFRREALSMLNLGTHPFIVQLHELIELESDTALVMEYIAPTHSCTSIEDYIKRTQDYTDRLLGVWAVQFCVGLEHAIEQGTLAHRDIKPANLLVGTDGFLKIADFGLALAASKVPTIVGKHAHEPTFFQQLQSFDGRSTCGTPGYIAPELLLGGHASVQSDMFSFGVTLWQLAARSMELPFLVPFRGDVAAFQREVLRSVQAGSVRPVDSPFSPVISQCLQVEPDRRYACLSEMREAIKDAGKRAGLGAMDFMVRQGFRGSFDDYLNRGRAYLTLGRRNRALRIFNRAVAHNPRSQQALQARGDTLYERGDNAGALRDFRAASELNSEWDAPIIGIAKTLINLDQNELAIQHLDRVLARHRGNIDALLEKSRAYAASGQRGTALALLDKIVKTNSRNPLAHEYLGRLLWEHNDLKSAARELAYSLDIDPLSTPTRLALAAVLTEGGQRKNASEQYLLAQAIHHADPEGLNVIAAHMSEHGHADEAIKLFREIAVMETDSLAVMLVNIGNAQINLGNEAAAAASFKEALRADPAYALAYRRLGNLEDWNDNHGQAAAYYARACVYNPGDPLNHSSAGTAYLRSGDPQLARDFLAASIRLLPEQPKSLYNLAVAQLQCEDVDNAIKALNQATRLDSRYLEAWYLKAQIEVQIDLALDAAHSVRQGLAADPQMKTEQARQLLVLAREYALQI